MSGEKIRKFNLIEQYDFSTCIDSPVFCVPVCKLSKTIVLKIKSGLLNRHTIHAVFHPRERTLRMCAGQESAVGILKNSNNSALVAEKQTYEKRFY